jgi:ABC-type transporter Mla MlaB component
LLDGTLTVRDVVSVKAALLAALVNQQAVQVACRKAESVDLSFIQLLLSARLTARRAGKHFMLAAPAEGALRAALEQGGFLPETGADPFWAGKA